MTRKRFGHAAFQVCFWLMVAIILFYVLFPFYWAVKTSLTPAGELARTALDWFPGRPVLSNYLEVFRVQPFGRNLLNSLMVVMQAQRAPFVPSSLEIVRTPGGAVLRIGYPVPSPLGLLRSGN